MNHPKNSVVPFASLFRGMLRVPILAVLFAGAASHAQTAMEADPALAAASGFDFREIIRDAKAEVFPSVVYIKVVREGLESGKKETQEVSGSGVLIDSKGHVLTNWHVVEKAIEVRCQLADGSAFDAEVAGTDKSTDLAVVRLLGETSHLPVARIGDSSTLQEGDFVMAMGAPWGMNRSVSIGIVSCTERFLEENSEYAHWLQTDAAISPGNSGGPLVNTAGEVIGINTRGVIMGGDMGFAVPSSVFAELVPYLAEEGEVPWSWTGLQIQPLRDFNRDTYFDADRGFIVAGTDPSSPARKAGIVTNDRVIAINGEPITAESSEDLPTVRRHIGLLPIGQEAIFTIMRGDESIDVALTPREKGSIEGDEYDCTRWDMAVKEINRFENPNLFFHKESGVFIFSTKSPGNAQYSGLAPQDIILSIDGKPVETIADLKAIHIDAVDAVDDDHEAVFSVLREGLYRQVVLDFLRDYEKE